MRFYKHRQEVATDKRFELVSDITRNANGDLTVKLHAPELHDRMHDFLKELKVEMYFHFEKENVKSAFTFKQGTQKGEFIITPKDVPEKEILLAFARENILSTRNNHERKFGS